MVLRKVKNVKGPRDIDCDCKTFICHWKNYSGGKNAKVCSTVSCNERDDLVGAHVILCDNQSTEYILPLCKDCNNFSNKDCFEIKEDASLVKVSEILLCKPCIVFPWE